jgi:hypothetical protein
LTEPGGHTGVDWAKMRDGKTKFQEYRQNYTGQRMLTGLYFTKRTTGIIQDQEGRWDNTGSRGLGLYTGSRGQTGLDRISRADAGIDGRRV